MKKGFTLSEVLITLGIIGVVAALTMPVLITKYEKKIMVERLKVAYSLLSQAVKLSEASNDESINDWNTTLSAQQFGEKYITPFLKHTKICTAMTDGCWITDDFNGYYDIAKTKIEDTVPYSLVLPNGMIVGVNNLIGYNLNLLIVDIDGPKGKNTMGRDVFCFYIFDKGNKVNANTSFSGGLYPGSYKGANGEPQMDNARTSLMTASTRNCNKNASDLGGGRPGGGAGCAAVIAIDGWTIAPDYPW